MKYTFQHYIDIQTSASSLTLFQVQAGGEYALQRIKHLLGAYKYIKLGRVSIKLLPASTLPVDPLGLSYDASDSQTVDPRDQMNPGLVRITNGEDILTDFSNLNDKQQEQMYINTMLDPRWSKFMLQSGFKRSAVPLYYTVGQLAQDPYPGAVVNVPASSSTYGSEVADTTALQFHDPDWDGTDFGNGNANASINRSYSDPRGLFQTGHRGRMGWMPTDAFYRYAHAESSSSSALVESMVPMFQPLPEINVITCLLPKAHKTVYYYRCFITETVYLSGLKNTGIDSLISANVYGETRAIDNFVRVQWPTPSSPSATLNLSHTAPRTMNDGGGEE